MSDYKFIAGAVCPSCGDIDSIKLKNDDSEIKWAHIDIAGTCWTDKNKGINPSGATGFGVKTLVQWIKNK